VVPANDASSFGIILYRNCRFDRAAWSGAEIRPSLVRSSAYRGGDSVSDNKYQLTIESALPALLNDVMMPMASRARAMSHNSETRGQSRRGDNTNTFANIGRRPSDAVGLIDCLSCLKAAFAEA
jgi:hypothetical protein